MALDYKERRKKAKEESLEEKRSEKAWKSVDILGCSYEEAYQMVLDDEAIEREDPLPWDLTLEQQKSIRIVRSAPRTNNGPPKKRTHEVNNDKLELMKSLMNSITSDDEITVLNDEREFEFKYNGVKYKVTLSAPRK